MKNKEWEKIKKRSDKGSLTLLREEKIPRWYIIQWLSARYTSEKDKHKVTSQNVGAIIDHWDERR